MSGLMGDSAAAPAAAPRPKPAPSRPPTGSPPRWRAWPSLSSRAATASTPTSSSPGAGAGGPSQPLPEHGQRRRQPAGGTQCVYPVGPVRPLRRAGQRHRPLLERQEPALYQFSAAGLASGSGPSPPSRPSQRGPARPWAITAPPSITATSISAAATPCPTSPLRVTDRSLMRSPPPSAASPRRCPRPRRAPSLTRCPAPIRPGGPVIPITVANASTFINDGGVLWDNVDASGDLSQVPMTKVTGTPAAWGQYAEAGGVYTFWGGTADLPPGYPGYAPRCRLYSHLHTYVPAPTFQVAAQCLGTCTKEYTLPDDNPVAVTNDDLWTGDAGVTLDSTPLIPLPYSNPTPCLRRPWPRGAIPASPAPTGSAPWRPEPRQPVHHLYYAMPPGAPSLPAAASGRRTTASPMTAGRL